MLRRRRARALMGRVSRPALQLWFEFASTYSYPAVQRIEALANGPGVDVEWKPFLLGPVFKSQGWNDSPFNLYPAKGRSLWSDLERLCAKYGLPFRRPSVFPRSSLLAARVARTAAAEPWCGDFVRAVFHANFADGRDIASVETVTAIRRPGRALVEAAAAPERRRACAPRRSGRSPSASSARRRPWSATSSSGATTGSRTRSRGRSRQPVAPAIGVDRPDLRQDAHALVGSLEADALVGTLEVDLHGQHVRARGRRRGRAVAAVEPGLDGNPAPGGGAARIRAHRGGGEWARARGHGARRRHQDQLGAAGEDVVVVVAGVRREAVGHAHAGARDVRVGEAHHVDHADARPGVEGQGADREHRDRGPGRRALAERQAERPERRRDRVDTLRRRPGVRLRAAEARRPERGGEQQGWGRRARPRAEERVGAERGQHREQRHDRHEEAVEGEHVAADGHHPRAVGGDERQPERGGPALRPREREERRREDPAAVAHELPEVPEAVRHLQADLGVEGVRQRRTVVGEAEELERGERAGEPGREAGEGAAAAGRGERRAHARAEENRFGARERRKPAERAGGGRPACRCDAEQHEEHEDGRLHAGGRPEEDARVERDQERRERARTDAKTRREGGRQRTGGEDRRSARRDAEHVRRPEERRAQAVEPGQQEDPRRRGVALDALAGVEDGPQAGRQVRRVAEVDERVVYAEAEPGGEGHEARGGERRHDERTRGGPRNAGGTHRSAGRGARASPSMAADRNAGGARREGRGLAGAGDDGIRAGMGLLDLLGGGAPGIGVGDAAPDFTLPDPSGRTVRLGDYRGREAIAALRAMAGA